MNNVEMKNVEIVKMSYVSNKFCTHIYFIFHRQNVYMVVLHVHVVIRDLKFTGCSNKVYVLLECFVYCMRNCDEL